MKLEEVLPAFREGKGIKRKGWKNYVMTSGNILVYDSAESSSLNFMHILEEDWEIETDKKQELIDKIWKFHEKGIEEEKELFEFIDTLTIE